MYVLMYPVESRGLLAHMYASSTRKDLCVCKIIFYVHRAASIIGATSYGRHQANYTTAAACVLRISLHFLLVLLLFLYSTYLFKKNEKFRKKKNFFYNNNNDNHIFLRTHS